MHSLGTTSQETSMIMSNIFGPLGHTVCPIFPIFFTQIRDDLEVIDNGANKGSGASFAQIHCRQNDMVLLHKKFGKHG